MEGWFVFAHSLRGFREEKKPTSFPDLSFQQDLLLYVSVLLLHAFWEKTGWEERTDVWSARVEETALQFEGQFFLLALVIFNLSRFPNPHTCSSCDLQSTRLVGAGRTKEILFALKAKFGCNVYGYMSIDYTNP
jgi:hypothetical protein